MKNGNMEVGDVFRTPDLQLWSCIANNGTTCVMLRDSTEEIRRIPLQ